MESRLRSLYGVERPNQLFRKAAYFSPIVAAEAQCVEALDLTQLKLEDLARLDDAAAFLSAEGLRFLAPQLLGLLIEHGPDALANEFIDTVFLHCVREPKAFFKCFSPEQRKTFVSAFLEVIMQFADAETIAWEDELRRFAAEEGSVRK